MCNGFVADDNRNDPCEWRCVTMNVAKCKQNSQRFKFCLSMSMFVFCFAGQSTTSAQETFSGCGILIEGDPKGCNFLMIDGGEFEFIRIINTGEFSHGHHVYVSGIVFVPDASICGSGPSLLENTIEQCPVCGDGLIGGAE